MPECLSQQQWRSFLAEELSAEEMAVASDHLSHCAACQELADHAADVPSLRREYHPAVMVPPAWDESMWSTGTEQPTELDPRLPASAGVTGVAASPGALGRYQLVEFISRGGFGEVWRAEDPLLGREVAIKMSRRDREGGARHVEGFLEEGRKLAALRHAGIVSIYDVGHHAGRFYIVTELVTGGTLASRLKSERLSHDEAVRIVARVARAAHAAHLQGLVHRDIKPSNVIIDGEGEPRLADFGLAVTEEEQLREGPSTVGTVAYMSPEQVSGNSHLVDARSDVYSLGVVLYQALTGRLPYQARSSAEMRRLIEVKPPRPPRTIDDRIPVGLEQICLKCLQKSMDERYTTAADLAEALECWLVRESERVSVSDGAAPIPVRDDRRRHWKTFAAAVVGLMLVVPVAVALLRHEERPPVAEADGDQLVTDPLQNVEAIAWTPYDTHDSFEYDPIQERFRFDAFGRAAFRTETHTDGVVELEVEFGVEHWDGWAGVFWGERPAGDGRQRCWAVCAGRSQADPRYRVEVSEFVFGPLSGRRAVVSATDLQTKLASLPGDDRVILKVDATVRQVNQVWLDSVPLLKQPVPLPLHEEISATEFGLGFFGRSGEISVYDFKYRSRDL